MRDSNVARGGTTNSGCPIKKCPGDRYSRSVESVISGVNGLEFSTAYMRVSKLVNSLHENMCMPMVWINKRFVDRIAAMASEIECTKRVEVPLTNCIWSGNCTSTIRTITSTCSFISAPIKFVPQSEKISNGRLCRATNRSKVAKNVSVNSSVTTSRCTALTKRHMKAAI